jgi:RNA polymerase sigma-70 factor (ECF subfamily)
MSTPSDEIPDELLQRAAAGDEQACAELLARHRDRLRRLIAVRLNRRLSARLDPSDLVQDVLIEAHRQLAGYLKDRPLPFYAWLRQIAWQRLIDTHRRHLQAQRRSVHRETPPALPDESVAELADFLVSSRSTPSKQLIREEIRARVRQALLDLSERDREVLVMRYLEQMAMAEIAAVLGVSEGAVKVRHLRALQRLQSVLQGDPANPDEKSP